MNVAKENTNKNYQERIQRLFQRVNNIHNTNKEEQVEKNKGIETVFVEMENKIRNLNDEK
jgi:hypothetical protein